VPGPSALVLALAASGLPTDRFAFLGFAPRKGRAAWWSESLARAETLVVFEAPTASGHARGDRGAIQERRICLAPEITKLHEESWTEVREVAR
jgi:16S rRNA (cytidine1402-2'-O)-methyltransferase